MSAARQSRLYHRLQLAAHRLHKAADRAVAAAGLTTAQAAVLAILAREGGASQREVARQLAINESAMTTMVARLMAAGLITRDRDARDARARHLTLTAAGERALGLARPAFEAVNARIEAALSEEEIGVLADLVTRLGAAFGEAGAD